MISLSWKPKKNWKKDTYKAFMDYLQDQFGK